MAHDYSVRRILPEIRKHPEIRTLFLSFNSDPCTILFYAALADYRVDFQADLPYGRVKTLGPDAWFVLRDDDDVRSFETRFGRMLIPAERGGALQLFRPGAPLGGR